MKLVFASNNNHKLEEIRQILPATVEVISLHEVGFCREINETGMTLEENSAIKATELWHWLHEQNIISQFDGVFADDTGLEIIALNGEPGVRTARWAGNDAKDVNNRKKALRELEGVDDRRARFRTVVTLISHGIIQQVEGIVNGKIALTEEGEHGFGYDSVFIPEGYEHTFATLPTNVKNAISQKRSYCFCVITVDRA